MSPSALACVGIPDCRVIGIQRAAVAVPVAGSSETRRIPLSPSTPPPPSVWYPMKLPSE
jgi:hypothetical protein